MMSLTTMSPSAWRYYVEEIARGPRGLLRERCRAFGPVLRPWRGSARDRGHEANAVALERLFGHGTDPRDGSLLGRELRPRERARRRRLRSHVLAAEERLGACGRSPTNRYPHRSSPCTRQRSPRRSHSSKSTPRSPDAGHNGVLQVDTEGLLAASFVHRTSRAADPQLHTHVLVANKVRADDGAWLALDGRELFATQKATGMLYKAALRAELTERLGVSWSAVDDNGAAEIEGVPPLLLDYWSARRHELKALGDELIANRSAELGRSLSPNERAECFQIAAYRTRTAKVDADTPTEELRGHWRAEGRGVGTRARELDRGPFPASSADNRKVRGGDRRGGHRSSRRAQRDVDACRDRGGGRRGSSTVSTRHRSASASTNLPTSFLSTRRC